MNQNIDFEVIWKKINNEASKEEEARLNEWLSESSSHRRYYENACRYYSNGTQFHHSPAELKSALKKIQRRAHFNITYRTSSRILGITTAAACILFFIYFQFGSKEDQPTELAQTAQSIDPGTHKAILILADGTEHDLSNVSNSVIDADGAEITNTGTRLEYNSKSGEPAEIKYNTLKIPRGGEYFLVLSDSTKVWLNSETTLRFPVQFATDLRSVELIGEAYFEVSKTAQIPFVVHSANQMIKVLGTQFNVSSYVDNPAIYTTLVEGKVEVSLSSNPDNKLILFPREQSIINQNENKIEKRTVDVSPYVAWKDSRFVFRDQMLEEIMNTLSKWYDVQVQFTNEKDKKLRFTGNLERYAEFDDILKKIERTNEVKFVIENNKITIN